MLRPALCIVLLIAGCSRPAAQAPQSTPPPVPVKAETARRGEAPVTIRTIGSVVSQASITLKPQVSAQVKEIVIPEGADVTAGHTILLLDSRPFDLELQRAQATLARDRAIAEDARRMVNRFGSLRATDVSSTRELETAQTVAASAEAQILADEASIEAAKLNISYCTIKAPFAGRLGQLLVKPGAIVKAEETDLVDLTQIDPVDISFSIREDQLDPVRAAAAKGPLKVQVVDVMEPITGMLTFIDNKVDTATGAIRLKASFTNETRRLWPGRFVNVALEVSRDADSVLVPDVAVQPAQSGPAVYVIKPDETVELRPVTVSRTLDGTSVIASGLSGGELVVTDGHLRLAPGLKVRIKQDAPPKG